MSEPHSHVLLVDDDEAFTDAMSRGFQRRGFSVTAVHSADEALVRCPTVKPSHIVLDLNMPGTSGLRALPDLVRAAPDARVLVLTGYSSIATAVEAMQAGAVNYLCKPASVEEVIVAFDGPQSGSAEVPHQPPSVDRLEWEHIQRVLGEHEGNISATARALGMHRRTLQRKLQKRPVKR